MTKRVFVVAVLALAAACADDETPAPTPTLAPSPAPTPERATPEATTPGPAPTIAPEPTPPPPPSRDTFTVIADEARSAGDATTADQSIDAFKHPFPTITESDRATFDAGRTVFEHFWNGVATDMSAFGGSGPLVNSNACKDCHQRNGRDRPRVASDTDPRLLGLIFRVSVPGSSLHGEPLADPTYGDQLQPFGRAFENIPDEVVPHVDYVEVGGLRHPTYRMDSLGYGPLAPSVMISPRVGQQLVGLGLLDAIPEAAILANADPTDADGDGISGHANRVWDLATQSLALGRFGWKANQPNLKQQNSAAFRNDLGLTSSMFPTETCNEAQKGCWGRATKPGPDVTDDLFAQADMFVRLLAVPARAKVEDPAVRRGREVFDSVGCAKCHTATFTTADTPQLAHQTIHPFTDLLLHDMGPDLADHRPDFEADGQEWRTPPLWGIGLVQLVNGHTNLLHDGRARSFTEAILWHGGEGQAARSAFNALPSSDRDALDAFLRNL